MINKNNLIKCFSKETVKEGYEWNEENPTSGHCAICSILVAEETGALIAKTTVNRRTHYFNILNDEIIDYTSEQFLPIIVNYSKYEICDKDKILKNKDTKNRYLLLKNKYNNMLKENK